VVHRDIKPGNIMITSTGQVKVMDFGIARAISASTATVAQTTAILGTAAYFSPEQAKGESVDARTDLYSAGVVLFEMLTGRPPFRGVSPVAVAYQHVSETPVKPSSLNSSVSPALDTVVLHALAKDRFNRYQSAVEFRADVDIAGAGHIPVERAHDETGLGLFGSRPVIASGSELALKQLVEDTTMVRTQRRPPVIWVWAGVLSVVVMVIAVMFWAFSLTPNTDLPDSSRRVPVLTGQTFTQAENNLKDLDLVAVMIEEADGDVPEGEVIRTDPPASTIAQPTEEITVYVSTGAVKVVIPDLVNQPAEQAQAALSDLGLVPGSITRQNSPSIAEGLVLRTDAAAGDSIVAGETVNLFVSSGLVTLSDLRGQTLSAASDLLNSSEVQLIPIPEPDYGCPSTPTTLVTRQSLAPGDVPQKSSVTLTYCAGSSRQ
jgi:serine/threonine-protein kinase